MTVSRCLRGYIALSYLALLSLIPSCSKDDDDPEPVVTADEELYFNEVYASGADWVEIYNKGNTSKDISGYKVYDDVANKYTLPAGTAVPGNGFLVIHCDDLGQGLHTNFKLTSTGETIYLENTGGEVIDKVVYPELLDGQSYGRYPDGSTNFSISGFTTQGISNGNSNAPAIVSVTRTPLVVDMSNQVTVKAEFLSVTGLSSVKLYYRANSAGAYTSLDMTLSNGSYTATIPALNGEGRIDYYVEANGTGGGATRDPHNAPDKTHSYLMTNDVLPDLVINEFMAFNSACCPDQSSGMDEYDDWIEIYNNGDQSVNIGGMYLSDDKSNPFNHKIPDTNPTLTTIPPGGYIVIWADNDKDQGELHCDFSLSNEGEDVGLYYYDGRVIDEFSFGTQTENASLSRSPNATGTFQAEETPTPGAVNQ